MIYKERLRVEQMKNKPKYLKILNNGVRVEVMNRHTMECGVVHYAPLIDKIAFYSGISESNDKTITEDEFIQDYVITNIIDISELIHYEGI